MVVCVECAEIVEHRVLKIPYCKNCNCKADKYIEINNAYKIIDLLLMKASVYRHFLLNTDSTLWSIGTLLILHYLAIISISLFEIQISALTIEGIEIFSIGPLLFNLYIQLASTGLYLLLLCIGFYKVSPYIILYITLFSSYFNILKIVFSMWQCTTVQHFIVIDVLNLVSNVTALSCIKKNDSGIFSTVFICKILSILIPILVTQALNYKT